MRKITLSARASKKLDKLLDYLKTEWSEKAKSDFIRKQDKSIDLIKKFPDSTEESDLKKGLHKCVVTKQTTIYYLYDSKTIKIVTIFDNRMDSRKLKKEI